MTQPRLRLGLVGCGLIAQVMHLHYLRELSDLFQVTALCDLSRTALDRLGEQYGVARRFTDWRALLEEPLDAVMVLTSGSHEPIAVAAAAAGRHVFIEKPIALSEAEGNAILAAGRRSGVQLMVGYMKRYDPGVERLAKEVADLTDLRLAISITAEFPLKWYVEQYPLIRSSDINRETLHELQADDDARVTSAIGTDNPILRYAYRNSLLDSMIHDINLMRGLLGDPVKLRYAEVRESGISLFVEFAATDAAMHWVNLKDGIAGYRQDFALFSPQRRLTLVFPSPFLRNVPTQLVIEAGNLERPESRRTKETVSHESAFKRELLEFHACITEQREPRTTAAEAVRDVAFCQSVINAVRV